MEPPKGFINIQKELAELNWMILSKKLIVDVIYNKCKNKIKSHPSCHGKVCFSI